MNDADNDYKAGAAGAGGPEDGGGAGEAFAAGDAEIERAVRAGLSVADARAFIDRGAFERVCAMLEAKGQAPGAPGGGKISEGSGKDGGGGDDGSADFDVPELTEDEEFDPKLVRLGSAVRKMGDALKSLREENRSLRERLGKPGEEAPAPARGAGMPGRQEERKALRIARPGGERGRRGEKTEDDILAEVAGEVASRFNI